MFGSPIYELAGEDGEGEGDEEEGAEEVDQALVEHQPLVPPRTCYDWAGECTEGVKIGKVELGKTKV